MAKKSASRNVGKKGFFTITVLSSSLLIMMFMTFSGVFTSPTNTETEASGVSGVSLNDCTSVRTEPNGPLAYSGGVKLFNGDNYTGGDRILCVSHPGYNNVSINISDNLNKKDISNANIHDDIWGEFQLKTESLKLRALENCLIKVKLYKEYDTPEYSLLGEYEIDRIGKSTHTKSIELPKNQDNKAKSIKLITRCKN